MFPVPYHPDFSIGYITLPFTPTPPLPPLAPAILIGTIVSAKVLNATGNGSLVLRATADSDTL